MILPVCFGRIVRFGILPVSGSALSGLRGEACAITEKRQHDGLVQYHLTKYAIPTDKKLLRISQLEIVMDDHNKGANDDGSPQDNPSVSGSLSPFNPVSESALRVALDLLQLGENDILFDLGAGDGRFLIQAALSTPSLRCVGIELDPKFVNRAELSMEKLSSEVRGRIQMRLGNALHDAEKPVADKVHACSSLTVLDATAIFLFLVPNGIKLLQPLLNEIVDRNKAARRSFRVATFMFRVPEWTPNVVNRNTKAGSPVYLYDFF